MLKLHCKTITKNFGGHVANTDVVYSNSNNPIYERIGVKLVSDSKIDLKKEIETFTDKK